MRAQRASGRVVRPCYVRVASGAVRGLLLGVICEQIGLIRGKYE